ncbi:MAG: BamA/TamA family outer membrane protein [Chloroflexota bacterium]|nr:BamA/TamA family outer membrane protein [Chloroflexota bacterium]
MIFYYKTKNTFQLRLLLVPVFVAQFMLWLPGNSNGQPATDTLAVVKVDPNSIPYETDRTVGQHILAFPSYLFHWSTWPVRAGFKYVELEFPELFFPEIPNSGILPFFELGSKETDIAYGLIAFNNRFFSDQNTIRFIGLFGSESYNSFELNFTNSKFLNGEIDVNTNYSNDPIQSLYGGNKSDLDSKKIYAIENLGGSIDYEYTVSPKITFSLGSSYKRLIIDQGDLDDDDERPISEAMEGTTSLLSVGGSVSFDFTQGKPRIYQGPRFIVNMDWGQSLNNTDVNFLRYSVEYNQFLPVPVLPKTRRLAFKSQFKKMKSLTSGGIPFFEQPTLGSNQDLRGFAGNRFRGDGSLLLTLEYRYPIWDFADIVLFVDKGQVFDDYSDIRISDFHTDYGFGFHLISGGGFSFRAEFAFSKETSRAILSVTPNI